MLDRTQINLLKTTFETYLGIFFWNFKRMDNAVYNFEILSYLYDLREKESDSYIQKYLNKPIIILNVSIAECIMFDFIKRIQQHVHEKIPNLTIEKIRHIKERFGNRRRIDLDDLISELKASDIFNWTINNENIYDTLDLLRKIRNRVHIQIQNADLDRHQANVFTESNLINSQNALESIIEAMIKYYPRSSTDLEGKSFPFAWRMNIQESSAREPDLFCPNCSRYEFMNKDFCSDCSGPLFEL